MRRFVLSVAVLVAACGGKGTSSSSSPPPPAFSQGEAPRAAPPSHAVGGFSIQLPSITLQPGDELQPCFVFPLTVDGPSHLVGGGSLTVGKGMHHGNITTRPKTGDGIRSCDTEKDPNIIGGEGFDVLQGGSVLFGSSTQREGTEWQSFPDGHAFRIRDGFEIVARMHYLNTTTAPLTLAPVYAWYTVDESAVVHEIAPFIWTIRDFQIPPQATKTVTGTCRIPQGMHIVNVLPHMHKLGTALTAGFLGGALDGQEFLASKGYDPVNGVIRAYDPPIDLSQGDGVTFACTWNNTLDKTITEGIGDNEMCMLFGYAWPPTATYTAVTSEVGACVYTLPPQK